MVAAMGLPLMDICLPSLIHELVPSEKMGRVVALWRYFAEIGMAAGFLMSGPIADWLGPRVTLLFSSLYAVPLTVVFLWFINVHPGSRSHGVIGKEKDEGSERCQAHH